MAAVRMGKLITIPAGLMCASISVHAAKEEELKKQLVKPEQLPIYTTPPLQSKYVEEQPGHLQMGFASIRKTTGHYIGWCKGVYVFVKNGIMDTVQFGKDAYVYLKNPPRDFLSKNWSDYSFRISRLVFSKKSYSSACFSNTYAKIGTIQRRRRRRAWPLLKDDMQIGSRFKKIAYPLGLATLGATVCYPVQSIIIAKVTGKKAYTTSQQIYEAVKSLWTKNNKKESLLKPKERTKIENSGEIEISAKTTHNLKFSVPLSTELIFETKTESESTSGATQFMPDPKLMDHGQSHPEDIDMYSTRS